MKTSMKHFIKYALLHTLLFALGITITISAYNLLYYLDSYPTNEKTFFQTYDFQNKYLKYLERLSLYIHYKESGYTVDISSLGNSSDLSDLLNDDVDLASINTNHSDQENFEFYNYCLNVQDTNFLYYVENTTTNKVYYSPYLEKLYGTDNLRNYVNTIQDTPAYFILNTKTGKYLSNTTNKYNQLSKEDLSWVIDTLSQPIQSNQSKIKKQHYIVYTTVLRDFPQKDDEFHTLYQNYTRSRTAYQISIYLLPTSCILFLFFLVLLICNTGKRNNYEGIYLNAFDRTFTELSASIIIFAFIVVFLMLYYTGIVFLDLLDSHPVYFFFFSYVCLYPIAMTGFLSLIRRIKAHTLWHNSAIFTLGRFIKKSCVKFLEQQNVTFKVALFLLLYGLIRLSALLASHWLKSTFLSIVLIILSYLYLIGHLMKLAIDLGIILKETKKVSEGHYDIHIDDASLRAPMNTLGSYVNQIGDGLGVAVEERLKSERFKTELITNVSHDIKTPLTSIINYVDLIKKEPIDNPKITDYLEILTTKSWRLKTLIEDLVEASKASAGTMKLNLECFNLVELVKQAQGEFDDRFHKNNLEFVLTAQNEIIPVFADGRNTYRIVENLLSNATKYALQGTRIYVDVTVGSTMAKLCIKNISKEKLNITPGELMERFVRGDVSRNTEGSGLGLSIARSLSTLQCGTFSLELDGDLFKAIVTFPLVLSEDS